MRPSPRTQQTNTLPFVILGSIGLLFLAATIFVTAKEAAFVLHANRTTGTFQGAVAHSGGNHGGTFLYPQFTFTTTTGQTITFTSKDGSTGQPYADGQQVPILYDPNAPNNAVLDSFWHLWLASVFLGVFVLGFLGIPFLVWRSSSRQLETSSDA